MVRLGVREISIAGRKKVEVMASGSCTDLQDGLPSNVQWTGVLVGLIISRIKRKWIIKRNRISIFF